MLRPYESKIVKSWRVNNDSMSVSRCFFGADFKRKVGAKKSRHRKIQRSLLVPVSMGQFRTLSTQSQVERVENLQFVLSPTNRVPLNVPDSRLIPCQSFVRPRLPLMLRQFDMAKRLRSQQSLTIQRSEYSFYHSTGLSEAKETVWLYRAVLNMETVYSLIFSRF